MGGVVIAVSVLCRMNNGPVIGYEEDVGRRTTFRLSYPESIFSDPMHYDPNTTVVLIVFKPRDLKWLWEILSGQKVVSVIIHALRLSLPHTSREISVLLLSWVLLSRRSTGSPSQSAQYPCPINASVPFVTHIWSVPHLKAVFVLEIPFYPLPSTLWHVYSRHFPD